jgi:hypothetical protein
MKRNCVLSEDVKRNYVMFMRYETNYVLTEDMKRNYVMFMRYEV